MYGAERQVSGAECYEPDAKLLSVEHGGIREQHRARSEEHGDIRDRNESQSVEHGAIHGRGGTQSAEHGAIRDWHAGRKVSEYGEIRRPARRAKYRARNDPETERTGIGRACKAPGAEQSAMGEEH
jgi:hypothetical protein